MTHASAVNPTRVVKRLRPQISPWMIVRQRLLDHLNDAANFPVTHIFAPAGYGKTTLLSHWVSQRSAPTPWLTFDAADNTIDQVVTLLIGAIQQVEPFAGNQTLSILNTGGMATPVLLAASLVDEIAILAHPVTIVLDDFHVLDDAETITFMESLFRRLPPNLHLLIGSRRAPLFATATLRGYGRLVEIDVASMAFSAEEATTFLRAAAGRPLLDHELAPMVDTADGLPAALQVCALSLRHSTQAQDNSRALASMTEDFLSFLKQEVLDGLPVEFQLHLVRLAVPERLTAGLAQALVADLESPAIADWTLPRIAQSGLFLSLLGAEGDWYQFHSLFRDALLARQRELLDPARIAKLHANASNWFLEHGDIDAAIRHSVQSNEPGRAAGIVAAHAQAAIVADRWLDVERWIEALDQESRTSNLEIMVAEAINLHARAQYDRLTDAVLRIRALLAANDSGITGAERQLHAADLAPFAVWVTADVQSIDGHIAYLRNVYPVLEGTGRFSELMMIPVMASLMGLRDPAATRTFLEAVFEQARGKSDDFSRMKVGWIRCAQSIAAWHAGNLSGMVEYASQSLAIAQSLQAERLSAQVHVMKGMALYERNDLVGAEQHFRAAATSPHCGAIFLTIAVSRHAICLNAMGRETECDTITGRFSDRLSESEYLDSVCTFRASLARIAYSRGRYAEALSLIDAIHFSPGQIDSRAMEIPWLFKAILLYQRGTPNDIREADQLLADVERTVGALAVFRHHLHVMVAQAFRAHCHGDDAAARSQFQEALRSAERRGFVRTLVDLGDACAYLLRALGDGSPYVRMLLYQYPQDAVREETPQFRLVRNAPLLGEAGAPPDVMEPLTNREIDILVGLTQRLSNKEIACELSISPLTVKTHLRNLYAKLGVNSRRQAIVRATALGVLE